MKRLGALLAGLRSGGPPSHGDRSTAEGKECSQGSIARAREVDSADDPATRKNLIQTADSEVEHRRYHNSVEEPGRHGSDRKRERPGASAERRSAGPVEGNSSPTIRGSRDDRCGRT